MKRIFLGRTVCMIIMLASLCTTALAQNESKPLEMGLYAGASLNSYRGDDVKNADMKVGFNVGITGRYFLYKNLFGELSIGVATKGYKQSTYASSGQYWDDEGDNFDSEMKDEMTTYNLDIPLYVGYRFSIGDSSGLSIKMGPYITYALSGQLKTTGYIIIYPDIHSSEKEYIDSEQKIGDIEAFNKFGAGIGGGISYNYKNYCLTATYQRGLTKIYKGRDEFEQNISLSLSYTF